jgi:hypothetical protein
MSNQLFDIIPSNNTTELADGVVYHPSFPNSSMPNHDIVELMSKFKQCYDKREFVDMAYLFSDNFQGNWSGSQTKDEVLGFFQKYLESLPLLIGLSLEINIYKVIRADHNFFSGIVDFKTKANFRFIKKINKKIESGMLYCEAIPDGLFDKWRIKCIDENAEKRYMYETNRIKNNKNIRPKIKRPESKDLLPAYSILDISPRASLEEVKKAYHQKLNENHPDKVSGLSNKIIETAEKETLKIIKAYKIIIEALQQNSRINI